MAPCTPRDILALFNRLNLLFDERVPVWVPPERRLASHTQVHPTTRFGAGLQRAHSRPSCHGHKGRPGLHLGGHRNAVEADSLREYAAAAVLRQARGFCKLFTPNKRLWTGC